MRFICIVENHEYIVESDSFDAAAHAAAERHATGANPRRNRYTVNVAEANEADFPLIAGDDYPVTLAPAADV